MAYLFLIAAALFWGGNYVIGKLLVHTINPMLLTEMRWLLTAVLLMILYHKRVVKNFDLIVKNIFVISILALLGQVLFPVTLYIGLQTTSSLNAAIYMAATPAFIILINVMFFKEKIGFVKVIGVLLSTIGVLFVITKGDLNLKVAFDKINHGDLWAMASALSWACYCTFLRFKSKKIDGQAFVTTTAIIGALIMLPILHFTHSSLHEAELKEYMNFNTIVGVIYLVIFPSWLSFVFWNKGISEVGATRGGVYTHIIPLSGGLLSIIFLNTHLHYYHIVGAILIAVGVFMCSKSKK